VRVSNDFKAGDSYSNFFSVSLATNQFDREAGDSPSSQFVPALTRYDWKEGEETKESKRGGGRASSHLISLIFNKARRGIGEDRRRKKVGRRKKEERR
jgi:hypothetical protein